MIGKKIKEVIEESSLTVSVVAEKLGTNPANMYKIFQKDTVQTDVLVKLAKILNEPITVFFKDIPGLKLSATDVTLLEKTIEEQKKRIDELERSLNDKQNILDLLIEAGAIMGYEVWMYDQPEEVRKHRYDHLTDTGSLFANIESKEQIPFDTRNPVEIIKFARQIIAKRGTEKK